jgi:hypothetical protein
MTSKEIAILVQMAVADDPHLQKKDMTNTVRLWYISFRDIEYAKAEAALVMVLSRKSYFPSVSDMRRALVELESEGKELDGSSVYGLIRNAVSSYGWPNPVNGLASLPPEVAELAREFGWQSLCENTNTEVLRGQITNAWNRRQAADKEIKVLPIALQPENRKQLSGNSLFKLGAKTA